MRSRPLLFLTAVLVLAIAVFFAGQSALTAQRAAADDAAKEQRLADARRRLQALEAEIAAAKPALPPASASAARAEVAASAAPSQSEPANSPRDSNDAAATRRASRLAAYRETLDETWGLLIAQLGLDPAQAAAFKDLLCAREENDLKLAELASAKGLTEDSPEIDALDRAFVAPWKTQLRAVLGQQGYVAYGEYFRDRHLAPIVTQIAGAAYAADTPIANDTAWDLLRALANASERKSSGTAIEDTIDWSKANEAAQKILTPEQYAIYDTMVTRLQSERQFEQSLKQLAGTMPLSH